MSESKAEKDESQSAAERRKLRPFRVLMYSLYLVFVGVFVALVVRSVWLDLYGKGPVPGLRVEHAELEHCLDELERLYGKLAGRLAFPTSVTERRDWDTFTREFEDRLDEFQQKCVNDAATPDEVPVRMAISHTASQLENWRQHLSRCGEEGESERVALAKSIADLREVARRTH